MDKNNDHSQGNGFIAGAVIGAIATLLFTTKKGREIVRELTDKGIAKISDLEKALEENKNAYKDTDGSDYIESTSVVIEKAKPVQEVKTEKTKVKKEEKPVPPKTKHSVKRYFRLKKGN